MKKVILVTLITCAGIFAQSAQIESTAVRLSPSNIGEVVKLVDKVSLGSAHKKVQVVVEDLGMSTDLSNRYQIYLSFASLAEMGNIHADFLVGKAVRFVSATRKSPGVYEVKSIVYGDQRLQELTQLIDASQMFKDENSLRNACGDDFCDQTLKTSIEVKSFFRPAK